MTPQEYEIELGMYISDMKMINVLANLLAKINYTKSDFIVFLNKLDNLSNVSDDEFDAFIDDFIDLNSNKK